MLILAGMSTWAPVASAAELVFYAERDQQDALDGVMASTGRALAELEPIPLADLGHRSPTLLGAGQLGLCALSRSTRHLDVAGPLEEAERHFAMASYSDALPELDRAAGALDCLEEPADVQQASRIHLLRGYILQDEAHDEERARAEYQRAMGFVPDLAWDLDESYRPSFDRARTEAVDALSSTVVLVPPLAGGVWVDGRPVDSADGVLTLRAGTHLVQIGRTLLTTLRVELGAGEQAELIVPPLIVDQIDLLLSSSAGRTVLDRAFGAMGNEQDRVHVVTGQQGWTLAPGNAWTSLAAVEPLILRRRPPVLTATGSTLAALGLGAATVFWFGIREPIDPVGLPDRPAEQARYKWSGTATLVSVSVGGLGAVLLGVGAARELGERAP